MSLLLERKATIVTVTPAFLRVEERDGREKRLTEIPADELEELELPTGKVTINSAETRKKVPKIDLPDTGVPRLPDGRPVPRILLSLMKLVRLPGIMARSDSACVQFGTGLPEDELRYLHALVKRVLTSGKEKW